MKMKVEAEVSKEMYEAMFGLAKFGAAIKKALADGWDMSQDLSPIITSAMADVLPAIQGVDLIGDEWKEDPSALVQAVILGAQPLVQELLKKEEVVEPPPEAA